MTFVEQLELLRDNPASLLTERCVLALGAFLFGYRAANAGIGGLLEQASATFASSAEADVCSRAYLANRNTEDALAAVVGVLLENAGAPSKAPASVRGPAAALHVIDFTRESLLTGRTGIVLLEPTIAWFADYVRGHTAGLRDVNPDLSQSQQESLTAFEGWLRDKYGEPTASWVAIVRVYEGADVHGLTRFIELWDEWETLQE
jgi:hypothetical protein